jgi:radical SAM-linked protein
VHYAKRGRLRFTSHRDFARALERAVRRAELPIAFSAGFSPHPKISYVGAAPTGVASEAEYFELGLSRIVDPGEIRTRLDAALPDGLDIIEVVLAGPGALPERVQASHWLIELADDTGIPDAVAAFLAAESVPVQRLTKDGRKELDARGAVVALRVSEPGDGAARAILDLVVRQATPSVRPDDVLAALRSLGAQVPSGSARATRLAQGPLAADGSVADPLAPDRDAADAVDAAPASRH